MSCINRWNLKRNINVIKKEPRLFPLIYLFLIKYETKHITFFVYSYPEHIQTEPIICIYLLDLRNVNFNFAISKSAGNGLKIGDPEKSYRWWKSYVVNGFRKKNVTRWWVSHLPHLISVNLPRPLKNYITGLGLCKF